MMKDFKYILKRIIIGVGIALVLSALKGKLLMQTYAQTITQPVNSYYFIDNNNLGATVQPSTSWRQWTGVIQAINYDFGNVAGVYDLHVTFSYRNMSISSLPNNLFIVKIFADNVRDTSASTYITCEYASDYSSGTCDIYANGVNATSKYLIVRTDFNFPFGGFVNPQYLLSGSIDITTLGSDVSVEDITNISNTIINSNQQNTETIINNQNQNTQDIINNQNQNTQDTIDSQKVCNIIDKTFIDLTDKALRSDGTYYTSGVSQWGVTDYIKTSSSTIEKLSTEGNNYSSCWYDENKNLISCFTNGSTALGNISVPSTAYYVRFSIYSYNNKPQYKICTNGNQALDNTLNNDDVSGANKKAKSFFDDFTVNSHGVSGIVTAPLRLIQSLSSSSCSSLNIPLPFVNENAVLPCMSSIYQSYFSSFLSLYRLITDGLIGYWVLIKIFGHIKGMQSPDDDRIEVFDL